ncbi:unnamed protein product [Camellia sinensis]
MDHGFRWILKMLLVWIKIWMMMSSRLGVVLFAFADLDSKCLREGCKVFCFCWSSGAVAVATDATDSEAEAKPGAGDAGAEAAVEAAGVVVLSKNSTAIHCNDVEFFF